VNLDNILFMNLESKEISAVIREARVASGLTLAECADGICSLSYLSLIETGHRIPSIKIVRKLVARLKIKGYYDEMEDRALINHDRVVLDLRLGKYESAARRLAVADFSPMAECLRGELLERQDNYKEAIIKLSGVFYDETIRPEIRFRAARALVRACRDDGQLNTGVEVGEAALSQLAPKLEKGDESVYELRGSLATVYITLGEFSRAEMLTDQNLTDVNTTPWARAMAFWAKADLYDTQGRVVEAEEAAEKALLIAETLDYPVAVANLRGIHAFMQMKKGSADLAGVISELEQAVDVFRELGKLSTSVAHLFRLAQAYALNGDRQKALDAIAECESVLDNVDVGSTGNFYASAANTMAILGEKDRATAYLLKAREELEKISANRLAADIWSQLAVVYEDLGDASSALVALKAAAELAGLGITQHQNA